MILSYCSNCGHDKISGTFSIPPQPGDKINCSRCGQASKIGSTTPGWPPTTDETLDWYRPPTWTGFWHSDPRRNPLIAGYVGGNRLYGWSHPHMKQTPALEWQPIETAPCDRRFALVYRPLAECSHDEPVAIKQLIGGNNHCWECTVPAGQKAYNPTDGACHVTHWMPLPSPPIA